MENKSSENLTLEYKTKNVLSDINVWLSAKDMEDCDEKLTKIFRYALGNIKDTCVISPIPEKRRTTFFEFSCYLRNQRQHFNVKFEYDQNDKISTFVFKNESITYLYNERLSSLITPIREKKYNKENGNEYTRTFSPYGVYLTLENPNDIISLSISMHFDENRDQIFIYHNEDKLKNYLLSLSFPVNIYELHRNIRNILGVNINIYPDYTLKVYKNTKDKKPKSGDIIKLNYGKKVNVQRTAYGKTVSLSENGWRYHDFTNHTTIVSNENGITITTHHKNSKTMNNNDYMLWHHLNKQIQGLVKETFEDDPIPEKGKIKK